MISVKRHVDSSVQKLETKCAQNYSALKTEFEVLKMLAERTIGEAKFSHTANTAAIMTS
jgi:hypothetical protein